MRSAARLLGAVSAAAVALLLPAVCRGQAPEPRASSPGTPASAVIEYPLRFAEHAAPQPGSPRDVDLVVGVLVGKEARAYPVNLLWYEGAHTVNDELGNAPIAVALCPIAGVASAFSRRNAGETIGISHISEVERDTLVLYDAATHSRWGLLTGEAFQGPLRGRRLQRLPSLFTTWARWKALHPNTTVYVAPTEAARGFELDASRIRRVVLAGGGPPRRADWIVGLEGRTASAAVLVRGLARERTLNEVLEDRPFVVFLTSDLTTTLVWSRSVAGRVLTFAADGDRMRDAETGSTWDPLSGRALAGPLEGRSLTSVPAITGFWHAWQAHHPETLVMGLPRD